MRAGEWVWSCVVHDMPHVLVVAEEAYHHLLHLRAHPHHLPEGVYLQSLGGLALAFGGAGFPYVVRSY